jgi:hypothetical protein
MMQQVKPNMIRAAALDLGYLPCQTTLLVAEAAGCLLLWFRLLRLCLP